MDKQFLKNESHVVRYCSPNSCSEGKVLVSSFYLRKKNRNEKELSVDHFEHYTVNHYGEISQALKRRKFTIKQGSQFAKLNVGTASFNVKEILDLTLKFYNDYDSHTLIQGMNDQDEEIAAIFVLGILETRSVV